MKSLANYLMFTHSGREEIKELKPFLILINVMDYKISRQISGKNAYFWQLITEM